MKTTTKSNARTTTSTAVCRSMISPPPWRSRALALLLTIRGSASHWDHKSTDSTAHKDHGLVDSEEKKEEPCYMNESLGICCRAQQRRLADAPQAAGSRDYPQCSESREQADGSYPVVIIFE